MAIASTLYFHASCDGTGCDTKYVDEYEDAGLILAETPEQLSQWLAQQRWLEHGGVLLCPECVDTLDDGSTHDFVTTTAYEPFCAICKQLPDAAHPNVPMLGQTLLPQQPA